ncbi:DNA cytosine methyltransferase [Chryseobacterium sp. T20]|uniref:DNA cytosine methyltransferase n=1 Tax=Chryseobacterium sp. T20 TaxID=3395375 RepID=UPI0039BD7B43
MIKIIDLFAGIGGIRRGFEQASNNSVKCVFTSEWDKYAAETYKANYPGEEVHGDITLIDEEDVPDHDVLLAGFPCQPFSQAGLKKGFDDTRGTLFFDIERILLAKRPKAFLLENVKRLRTHDGGRTLEIIIRQLKSAGYNNLQYEVLRARDFGLPQNRERILIVGFLDDNVKFEFPKPLGVPTRVGDILEKNPDEKYTISDRLWEGHQRRKKENKLKGKGFGFGIVDENSEYTNTISARYYKDGSEILISQKNKNPRKLTPREAARLQGFPDTFKIVASDNQAYKQFGNSVPVNLMEAVASEMLKSMEEAKKIKKNKRLKVAE